MIAESYLSVKKGLLSEVALNQIVEQLKIRYEGIEIADKVAIAKIIQNNNISAVLLQLHHGVRTYISHAPCH
jgi:hypothetical protein